MYLCNQRWQWFLCVLLVAGVGQTDEPTNDKNATELSGECYDSQGDPISAVTIGLYQSSDYIAPLRLHAEAKTDEEGKFHFSNLDFQFNQYGQSQYTIVARIDGYASSVQTVSEQQIANPISFRLTEKPGTLVGVITGPDGKPVANALVHVPYPRTVKPLDEIWSGRTDGTGKFRIADLTPWKPGNKNVTRNLLVTHPDFATTYLPYQSVPQVLKLQLSEPAVITGHVIDDVSGKPLPNVIVSAQGVAESGWGQVRTDDQGRYKLLMTPDRYNIWSEMDDRIAIAADFVRAVPGETTSDADIHMVRGGIVHGFVVDPSAVEEKPFPPNLRVAHYGPARPRAGAAVTSTKVNKDGSYRIRVAPGENYIYLMSGGASATLNVKDGQEKLVQLIMGEAQDLREQKTESNYRLRMQRAREELEAWRLGKKLQERGDSKTAELLDRLQSMNSGELQFSTPWLETLKQIADLGPDAVPDLIKELDKTDNNMMLRCMGFLLRTIDDKRAVPALIRAIPKTLKHGGSDMGLRVKKDELKSFAQDNDLDKRNDGNEYGFGRPIREIIGALHKLTDKKMGDESLFHVHYGGTEGQKALQEQLFQKHTAKWAKWWEQNASDFDVPKDYWLVKLPPAPAFEVKPVELGVKYKTDGHHSNWIIESVYAKNPRTIFHDFDTGRTGRLPQKWKDVAKDELPIDDIAKWARSQGFDMMGTEVDKPDGTSCYAIRLLGMRAMQLPQERWKMRSEGIKLEDLVDEGTPIGEYLFAHQGEDALHDEHAPFFAVTAEETPFILFLGIEVRDDSLKPGGVANGDSELKPVAFRKGRRYGFAFLTKAE